MSETSTDENVLSHHNIVLGNKAGQYLTIESYQFRLKVDGVKELEATMSEGEYKSLTGLLQRAIRNQLEERWKCIH